MKPLLLILGIFLVIFLVATYWDRRRVHKIARMRSGQGFNEFVAYFSGEDIPLYKQREVYDYFQDWQGIENFPVHPSDNLIEVYGIYNEDLDEAVIELANRWRAKLPPTFEGLGPVLTVADVVHLLNQLPQEETVS